MTRRMLAAWEEEILRRRVSVAEAGVKELQALVAQLDAKCEALEAENARLRNVSAVAPEGVEPTEGK